ncbi:hypothetical protein Tco_1227065 [Tanacetum coccineum]
MLRSEGILYAVRIYVVRRVNVIQRIDVVRRVNVIRRIDVVWKISVPPSLRSPLGGRLVAERSMISRANEKMSVEAPRSCPSLFVLSEALRSLKAEGSVWDDLRCVLAIPLR